MSIELSYNAVKGVTLVLCTESVTFEQIERCNDALHQDRRAEVWDFNGIKRLELSHETIHRLAIQHSRVPEDSPLAKVALAGAFLDRGGMFDFYRFAADHWVGHWCPFAIARFDLLADAFRWVALDLTEDLPGFVTVHTLD